MKFIKLINFEYFIRKGVNSMSTFDIVVPTVGEKRLTVYADTLEDALDRADQLIADGCVEFTDAQPAPTNQWRVD